MRHLTRDFLTIASASCPGTNMYALAIFLVGCGGYTFVGQTNFDISSGSLQVTHGISASINTVGSAYDVFLPTGSYRVSRADVNRILVLQSQLYPTYNSGLFRVTGFNSVANTLRVDYRSAATPPPEQYLGWGLYLDEVTASLAWRSGSNGTAGYGSWSPASFVTASASRVVLKSPDVTSWQVRMCLESLQDVSGNVPSGFSIAPGYGGTTNGDFVEAGPGPGSGQKLFLHTALHHNSRSQTLLGTIVGLTPCLTGASGRLWSTGSWRISMSVDDVSGSCTIVNRGVSLPIAASSGSGWAAFGLCEDETTVPSFNNLSDPSINCRRLFVAGSSNAASNLTWTSQFHVDNNVQVVGFGRGRPVPGVLSCYSDVSNPGKTHSRYLTSSVDSPWTGTNELLDVEVFIGTVDQAVSASAQPVFQLQPRRLGRLPVLMQGRANATQWSMFGSNAYYHTLDGVYMAWNGPAPTDATTQAGVVSTSGSLSLQQGAVQFDVAQQGGDPAVPAVASRTSTIDAGRFRKTYSYYRQVPVNVGIVKGG